MSQSIPDPSVFESDERWMQMAIAEAVIAGSLEEVPVGAVVVQDGIIIGSGGNRRESAKDPTHHAEIEAIQKAALTVGGWRLVNSTLYVTQEPCPMCAGAIVNARIPRVVYGCNNPKAGAVRSLYQLLEDPRLNHRCQVTVGVLAKDCSELLTQFFERLRTKRKDSDT